MAAGHQTHGNLSCLNLGSSYTRLIPAKGLLAVYSTAYCTACVHAHAHLQVQIIGQHTGSTIASILLGQRLVHDCMPKQPKFSRQRKGPYWVIHIT